MTVLYPDGRVEGSLPKQDEPKHYTREEIKRDHPIAYRKAMQRAAEENRKRLTVTLKMGKVTLHGRP